MKKIILMTVLFLALTGCTQPASIQNRPSFAGISETSGSQTVLTVYFPDETAESLAKSEVLVDTMDAESIVRQLILRNVLSEGTAVNQMSLDRETDSGSSRLSVDFNAPFLDRIRSMGSTGEALTLGSVANTFLAAFHADSILITVEGRVPETGHNIYDFPLTFSGKSEIFEKQEQ